jgi:hypothetical protein
MRETRHYFNDLRSPCQVPTIRQELEEMLGSIAVERGSELALTPWRREPRAAIRAVLAQ